MHRGQRDGSPEDEQCQVCPEAPIVDGTGDHEGFTANDADVGPRVHRSVTEEDGTPDSSVYQFPVA